MRQGRVGNTGQSATQTSQAGSVLDKRSDPRDTDKVTFDSKMAGASPKARPTGVLTRSYGQFGDGSGPESISGTVFLFPYVSQEPV